MNKYQVFGYGSLLNHKSLQATAPRAGNVQPAYIQGFKRSFDLIDEKGFTDTNLDLAGLPYCAVNITQNDANDSVVNGIVLEVAEHDYEALIAREHDYRVLQTMAYDFTSGKPIGLCLVFVSDKRDGVYDFTSEAQARYLQTCLDGARHFGADFYQQFIDTTYINDKPLSQIAELKL